MKPGGESLGLVVFAAMAGSVLGAALQLQQSVLWHWASYAVLTVGALAAWLALHRWRRSVRGLLSLALLIGAMGSAGLAGVRAVVYAEGALPPALEGRDLQVVGLIPQMPQRGEGSVRFAFDVESADLADVPRRLSLAWYAEGSGLWGRGGAIEAPGPVHAGERWRFTVRLKAPHGSLNPHGFDHELRLWEQGVHATGYVRNGSRDPRPELLAVTWRHPVERLREAVRDAVVERVPDSRQSGVIAALVTGDQNAIDRADWDVFRATGVAHLMAISGLHITMFAWLAALMVDASWRRSGRLMLQWPAQHAGVVGGVFLATLYAIFSGWGVPSQRTVWMLVAVGLLRLTGRRWPWPFVWLCACAVVVALDPWALTQPGFWLSFVAVGVLFAANSEAPSVGRNGIGSGLARLFREQWVVTLALTPLTLLLFQQVSVVGLLANAVAIPWVTLVVTPLSMLGVLLPPLWDAAAWSVQVLSWLLQGLARLPFATVSMAAPPLWMAVAGVAGGLLLAMRLPWSMRTLGLPLALPVLLLASAAPGHGRIRTACGGHRAGERSPGPHGDAQPAL